MKIVKAGDYIAFGFNYNGGVPNEIIVDEVTLVMGDEALVHFMYGYKSMGEWIKKEDIIAIGNDKASGIIPGYSGRFNILIPNHPLLK